jgi:predicted nucleotidyltransferase
MPSTLEACSWPTLTEPYNKALREAVSFILDHVPDVMGVIVSGTILRGTPAPASDLDIYVVRENPERQRIQRWFNDVPAEIFINPIPKVREYMESERKQGRPITAHMISTGFVVLNVAPQVATLIEDAREMVAMPPDLSPQALTAARYMAAARFEDAMDVAATRPETARMILSLAVRDMLHYRFLAENRHVPRDKDLLKAIEAIDPTLAQGAQAFYGDEREGCGVAFEEARRLAHAIADRTIETYGFFAWASEPEATEGPSDERDEEQNSD